MNQLVKTNITTMALTYLLQMTLGSSFPSIFKMPSSVKEDTLQKCTGVHSLFLSLNSFCNPTLFQIIS